MENNNNEVIVVGGDHYNTLWVCRSLGLKKYNVKVIIYDDAVKSFVAKSKYVSKNYYISSEDLLIDLLLNKIRPNRKTVIITASDNAAECLDKHLDQLDKWYYLANCNNRKGDLVYWMDKKNMLEAAKHVGFNYIPTIVLDLENIKDLQSLNLTYPCLLKPEMSSHGKKTDFRICNDLHQLKTSLEDLKQSCRYILVQKYLKPDYEVNLMGISFKNYCFLSGIVRKLKTCSSTHNMGMMTFSYLTNRINDFVDENLVNAFVKEIGYNGIFSMEFLISNGKPYFLEINLRTDGTMYMHTEAGINLPQIWADFNYKGESVGPFSYQKKRVYGMTEISYVKYLEWKHPIKVLREWWKTDCYSIFSWSDIKPFFYKFIYAFH